MRALRLSAVLMMVSLGALAGRARDVSKPDAAYMKSFEEWKAGETADLKQNWLTLAGLFWLKEGVNTFGSASTNSIVFPKGAAQAGEFVLDGKEVTVSFTTTAQATIGGKALPTATLQPDTTGHETVVEMGSLRFFSIVRGERVGIRVKDLDAPAAHDFHGMVFFPIDLNYRVTAKFVPSDGKQTIGVPDVLGDVTQVPVPGVLVFTIDGKEARLTPTGGSTDKGLSFVFNDLTAKTETYPGGRFLKTGPVKGSTVELDFNRAYSPPCAVTPYATCPLAPKENRLAVAIPVGEKYDRSAHPHH